MVFWISLAVLLVAVIVGIAFCVLRGLQMYRNAKRVGGQDHRRDGPDQRGDALDRASIGEGCRGR